MPIITEKYSNPQWGFLNGLGAPIPYKTAEEAGWPSVDALKQAQEELKKSIIAADKAIYTANNAMPGIWAAITSYISPGSVLIAFMSSSTRENIKRGAADQLYSWEQGKKLYWEAANHGTITANGVTRVMTPTEAANMVNLMSRQVVTFQEVVQLANDTTVDALYKTAAKSLVENVIAGFKAALDTLGLALEAINSLARGGATAVKWLPWLIVGAIVIPFGLRAFGAYKKGGVTAAADYSAGAIESGRSAAANAAAAAAKKAANMARPGLFGAPKRRRKSRK